MTVLFPYAGAERIRTYKREPRNAARHARPAYISPPSHKSGPALASALKQSKGKITMEVIIAAVADQARIPVAQLLGNKKDGTTFRARQLGYSLSKDLTGATSYAIAYVFRRIKHSTVTDGIRAHRKRVKSDIAAAEAEAAVRAALWHAGNGK